MADPSNLLNALTNIAKGVSPQTTTQSQTTTVNSATQAALLQQILQGTQGLASVAGGQKSAGMYNSTVNQQMINDLLARASTEIASKSSTTTAKSTTSPAVNVGQTAKLAAILQSLSTGKKLLGDKNVSAISDKLMSMFTGGDATSFTSGGSGLTDAGFTNPVGVTSTPVQDTGVLSSDINSLADMLGVSTSAPSVGSLSAGSTSDYGMTDADLTAALNGSSGSSGSSGSFSAGSTDAATSGQSSSAAGTDVNYIKAAQYASNPKARGDILDLSDGDWKDDISDITDAVSVVVPEAGMVRPGLSYLDALWQEHNSFFTNTGNWWDNLTSGHDPLVQNTLDMGNSAVAGVVQTGKDVGSAAETVGNAVGDVFQQLGDFFHF